LGGDEDCVVRGEEMKENEEEEKKRRREEAIDNISMQTTSTLDPVQPRGLRQAYLETGQGLTSPSHKMTRSVLSLLDPKEAGPR
jgi:uncharacterized protein YhaN